MLPVQGGLGSIPAQGTRSRMPQRIPGAAKEIFFFQKDWPLLLQTRVELKIGDS